MSERDDRPVLVTGGAGFIGCNIADRLASLGHDVIIFDALLRPGVAANLEWLEQRHGPRITRLVCDIRDTAALEAAAIGAKAVFHMAAQVAVTTSMIDPRRDLETNVLGTFALLDILRTRAPDVPLIFASTNKVYGDLADIALGLEGEAWMPTDAHVRQFGVAETRPLDFHTPYGCSKGAADQYVLDYARSYQLRCAALRMSCIYGQRQMGTEDQGWVAHFLIQALRGAPISIYGDGFQVRDILDVSDVVDAYLTAWMRIDSIKGRALNLGGGSRNAVSLRKLIGCIEGLIGDRVDVRYEDWRAGDQRYFVADTRAAEAALGFAARTPWRAGVAQLADWLRQSSDMSSPPADNRAGVAA